MNYLLLIFIFVPTALTQIVYYYKYKKLEVKYSCFLEQKTDEMIDSLRKEIPMGETFLRGSLLEKIKTKSKQSVLSGFTHFKKELIESKEFKWAFALPWLIAFLIVLFALNLDLF